MLREATFLLLHVDSLGCYREAGPEPSRPELGTFGLWDYEMVLEVTRD